MLNVIYSNYDYIWTLEIMDQWFVYQLELEAFCKIDA